jgi:hypothetical protein
MSAKVIEGERLARQDRQRGAGGRALGKKIAGAKA